ncbi:MAG TPA: hypothetical protein QF555_04320 [Candidatus Thalassarchaeaceae archaeon]|jgi:hypothetical protein|nr:hypothetical protein [Candidatus Thalassarchaeaceae archaeon]
MADIGDLIFSAISISRDEEEETLGIMPTKETTDEIVRGFMGNAEDTDIVEIRIETWTIGQIGPDAKKIATTYQRDACPICTRTTFWIEGDEVRASCHHRLCRAWIEPNSIDKKRIDCGWPSAQRTEACEDFEEARIVLTRMRAESEAESPIKSSVIDETEF